MGKSPPHEDSVRTGHVLRGVGDLCGRYAQLVGRTQRPVRIAQCGAANFHGIGFAMGQNLGRLLRLGDKTHRGHRNIGLGLDLLGERHLIVRLDRNRHSRHDAAGGYVHHIDAMLLQHLG